MFFNIIFLIFLQIALTFNKETGCGCGTNRAGDSKLVQNNNIFSSITDKDQCPIEYNSNGIYKVSEQDKKAENMVLIPAGEYQFGTDDIAIEADKEGPKKLIKLDSFYLDKYEVSNRDFMTFVRATNYKTEAEQFGDSFVFTAFLNSTFKEELKDFRVAQAVWWYKVLGADWSHPHGPDSDINGYFSFITVKNFNTQLFILIYIEMNIVS